MQEIWANIFLGVVSVAKGNMNEGINLIEKTRQSLQNDGLVFFCNISEFVLGKVYLQMVEKSQPISLSTVSKNFGFLIKTLPFAAQKAESHFLRVIEFSKKYGSKHYLGLAFLDLGYVHKAKKRPDKAKECFSEAIQIFEMYEMIEFLKQAQEALASLKN